MKTRSPLLRLNLHQSGPLLAALALLAAPQAQAQLYTGSGSSGLWSTNRWSADTNGPFSTAWGNNSNAVFLADTAYTFTGGGTTNIGNVTVGSGASVVFSLTSGTLATDGNVRTLNVGANAILDFNSQPLSTTAGTGFIKTGDGVYATGGGNVTGGFTLNGGTVVIRGTTGLGSGGANVLTLSNGVIAANANRSLASTRFPGGIRIAGNFQLGALSNSYATNAQALILDTANISFANNVSLQGANRTITLGGNGTGEFSGVISDGGLTVTAGAGVTSALLKLTGSSANTYTGLTTVSAGDLTLSKTAAIDAIAGNALVNGTGTLTLGAANQINNASQVEVAAGTFALAAFNETVNGVKLTGGTITGTTGVLTSSTAYDFQSSGNVTGILAGTAGANKTTAGTVTFSGGNANTYTGLTTVSAGSLVLNRDNNVDALAGDVLVNGTGTLAINKIDQIKNTANVEVAAGTLAISGNAETVNGVKLTGGAITGSGNASVLTSTTAFDFQSGSSTAVLSGTAGLTKTTGGTVSLGRASTYSGGTTLSDGTLQIASGNAGSVGSITSSAIGTGTLNLNGGTLSSGSTTSRTILNAVAVGGNVILGDAVNNGTLTFSAGVGLGEATRTLTTDSVVEFTGVVGGAGGIIKQGTSTLRLLGENTYAGGTTISSGILQIGLGGTSGSVVGDIAVDGELIFNKTDSAVLSNTLTGTGVLTKNGAGTLILTTAASAFSGTTTTSGGVLALSNANALSNSVLQLNADGNRIAFVLPDATDYRLGGLRGTAPTLVIGSNSLTLGKDAGTNASFGGVISGTGGLTKVGSSTQTLAGTNTYSGTTTVSGGTLSVNGSTAGGAVSVSSGATLAGSGTVGGATTINSGAFHSPGNSPGVQTFTNGLTYSSGSTFVWELTGNTSTNTDRGITFDGVNVSGGTLTINGGVTNNLVFSGVGSTVNWSDAFWASNQEWLVFSNASLPTVSSNVFETINVGVDSISQSLTSVRSGSSFSWDTIGDDVYLTYAIPEPSTYALLALLGAGFASRALVRRRRRHGVD